MTVRPSRSRSFGLSFALAAVALIAPPLFAQVPLTRVADQTTPVPGASDETFAGFGEGTPVISKGAVSFFGEYPSGSGFDAGGIFVEEDGLLRVIADRSTSDPAGSAETFETFLDQPWIGGQWVTFIGSLLGRPGVYLANGSISTPLAEWGDPAPGSSETFETFLGSVMASTGGIGIHARTSGGGSGIYLAAPLGDVRVADETTPIPGGGGETFADFQHLHVDQGDAYFVGSNFGAGRIGVYAGAGGPLTIVVDDTVTPPGAPGPFTQFRHLSADEGTLAFVGDGSGFSGIYLASGGTLSPVVDLSTPRPGGGTFSSLGAIAYSGGTLLFVDAQELYSWRDGEIERLVGPGDAVDGRIVDSLFISSDALDGELFTVALNFTDDSVGIYRGEIPAAAIDMAEVPTLGEWGLILLALSIAAAAAFVLRAPA